MNLQTMVPSYAWYFYYLLLLFLYGTPVTSDRMSIFCDQGWKHTIYSSFVIDLKAKSMLFPVSEV